MVHATGARRRAAARPYGCPPSRGTPTLDGVSDDAKVSLGKGRPTPKRSEAGRRRSGPVAPPPATRKEAARRLREERAEQRRSGNPAAGREPGRVLKRDLGPVRALARDVVDGRRNLAVLMLPAALLLVLAQLVGNAALLALAVNSWTVTLLAVVLDLVFLAVLTRRRVREAFPDERTGAHVGYALLRSTVLRRWRMPPPRVAPGPVLPQRRR